MLPKHTILIIDDEKNILNALSRLLKGEDRQIYTAETASEGWEKLKELGGVSLVICDNRLPDLGGIEFLVKVRRSYPDTIRMLITGYPALESAIEAINKGQVHRYITKPWENEELKLIVKQALDYYDVLADNRALLRIARKQAEILKEVQKKYPEFSHLGFDKTGMYIVDEKRVSEALAEFLKKYYPDVIKE